MDINNIIQLINSKTDSGEKEEQGRQVKIGRKHESYRYF